MNRRFVLLITMMTLALAGGYVASTVAPPGAAPWPVTASPSPGGSEPDWDNMEFEATTEARR